MKRLLNLLENMQAQKQPSAKTLLLYNFLKAADENTINSIVHLFLFRDDYRLTSEEELFEWYLEINEYQQELLRDCLDITSNLLEIISLLLQNPSGNELRTEELLSEIKAQKALSFSKKKPFIQQIWRELDSNSLFLFLQIITGSFSTTITQKIIFRSLSLLYQYPEEHIRNGLSHNWNTQKITVHDILKGRNLLSEEITPISDYPIYIGTVAQIEEEEEDYLFPIHKSILAFCILKNEKIYIQYFNNKIQIIENELIDIKKLDSINNSAFFVSITAKNDIQELENACTSLDFPLHLTSNLELIDILEYQENILKEQSFLQRRNLLTNLETPDLFTIATPVSPKDISGLGIMIPHRHLLKQSAFLIHHPLHSITAVLTHATLGMGKRQAFYTEFSFSIYIEGSLKTIVKLKPSECGHFTKSLHQFIAKNTSQKFGNMIAVKPEFICEISFKNIEKTDNLHKPYIFKHPALKRHCQTISLSQISNLSDIKTILQS